MKGKEFIADYFRFSRRDRIAILVITALLIILFLLPEVLVSPGNTAESHADTAWMAALQNSELKPEKEPMDPFLRYNETTRSYSSTYTGNKGRSFSRPGSSLFYFDPNSLSAEEWKKLGLRDKTIHTIRNYLAKGGRFRKPEDLQKIYGLFPDEYSRIAPYIKIRVTEKEKSPIDHLFPAPSSEKLFKGPGTPRYPVIDINAADTTAFISLPGIGSRIASRIVNFREKLGGFYSIDQVAETYGLQDSVYKKIKQYLKLENTTLRKININTATAEELKAHPYFRWNLANPILAYRNEHGPFARIEDIRSVMAVTEEVYKKISAYLSTGK